MVPEKALIETKKGKMSKSEAWKHFYDTQDLEFLNDFLHNDFMLIENFTMTVKEDALKMFQDLIDSNFKPSDGSIIAETDNLLAVEYIHEQNGEKIRHTMVQLWKDGKAWREIDTEEKVND